MRIQNRVFETAFDATLAGQTEQLLHRLFDGCEVLVGSHDVCELGLVAMQLCASLHIQPLKLFAGN